MIAAAVCKEFGVMACDSAMYVADKGDISFEASKLAKIGKYLFTFIGSALYFVNMDRKKFDLPMDQLSFYLQSYLRAARPEVDEAMKSEIQDPDENNPHLCMYVMGVHAKRPTLAQFNSFLDFKPKYAWSDNGLKYSSIIYGDDSKPEKQEMFKESTRFMENLSTQWAANSPGIVGEILTRGIYKKADLEMEIGTKKKYAGGVVQAAVVKNDGLIYALSTVGVV